VARGIRREERDIGELKLLLNVLLKVGCTAYHMLFRGRG